MPMRIMFVTPLEQAIIDRLRTEHIAYQSMVCNALDLPFPEDVLKYVIDREKRHGKLYNKSDIEVAANVKQVEEKQMQNMRRFSLDGYGEIANIGMK